MLRKVTLLTMMALLIATGAFATDFTNGGFETGDFTGWTKNGGQFTGCLQLHRRPG